MRVAEKAIQRRIALALAHLCSPDDQGTIFIDNNGVPLPSPTFDIVGFLVHVDCNLLTKLVYLTCMQD